MVHFHSHQPQQVQTRPVYSIYTLVRLAFVQGVSWQTLWTHSSYLLIHNQHLPEMSLREM